MLYNYLRPRSSPRIAILACLWVILGALAILAGNDVIPGVKPGDQPLRIWANLSVLVAAVGLVAWVWRLLKPHFGRQRPKS